MGVTAAERLAKLAKLMELEGYDGMALASPDLVLDAQPPAQPIHPKRNAPKGRIRNPAVNSAIVLSRATGWLCSKNTYRSLTTIARAIAGTAWSGPRFFGVRPDLNGMRDVDR
jgi:hypothetical protein